MELINGIYVPYIRETFYLSKDLVEGKVYLPKKQTERLKRHQLNGLRFIYRQFKKKKPGVIINDAAGFGKKVQTIVFLDALKYSLCEPALILCDEAEKDKWTECFKKYGTGCEDVSFDANKPLADNKVKIYLSTLPEMAAFIQTDWSVVVVAEPVPVKMFKSLKCIKAAFKIWIISIDLRFHLNTFAAINEWINPFSSFSLIDVTLQDKKNVNDFLKKTIILDRYFEELVLSRGHKIDFKKKRKPPQSKTTVSQQIKKTKVNVAAKKKNVSNKYGEGTSRSAVSAKSVDVIDTSSSNSSDLSEFDEPIIIKKRRIINIKTVDSDEDFEPSKGNNSVKVGQIDSDTIKNKLFTKQKVAKVNSRTKITNLEIINDELGIDTVVYDEKDTRDTKTKTSEVSETINDELKMKIDLSDEINTIDTDLKSDQEYSGGKETPGSSIAFDLNTIPIPMEADIEHNKTEDIIVFDHEKKNKIQQDESNKNLDLSRLASEVEIGNITDTTKRDSELTDFVKGSSPLEIVKEVKSECSRMDASTIDSKIRNLEEESFNKFQGSFLDKLLRKGSPQKKTVDKKTLSKVNETSPTITAPSALHQEKKTTSISPNIDRSESSSTKSSPQKIYDKIKDLEQKTYDKFKGSLLDRLF